MLLSSNGWSCVSNLGSNVSMTSAHVPPACPTAPWTCLAGSPVASVCWRGCQRYSSPYLDLVVEDPHGCPPTRTNFARPIRSNETLIDFTAIDMIAFGSFTSAGTVSIIWPTISTQTPSNLSPMSYSDCVAVSASHSYGRKPDRAVLLSVATRGPFLLPSQSIYSCIIMLSNIARVVSAHTTVCVVRRDWRLLGLLVEIHLAR